MMPPRLQSGFQCGSPPTKPVVWSLHLQTTSDGKKFDTLETTNGTLVWFSPYTQYELKIGWKKFHELMIEHATQVEKR